MAQATYTITMKISDPQVRLAWLGCLLENTGAVLADIDATPSENSAYIWMDLNITARTLLGESWITIILKETYAVIGESHYEYADPDSIPKATRAYLEALGPLCQIACP